MSLHLRHIRRKREAHASSSGVLECATEQPVTEAARGQGGPMTEPSKDRSKMKNEAASHPNFRQLLPLGSAYPKKCPLFSELHQKSLPDTGEARKGPILVL